MNLRHLADDNETVLAVSVYAAPVVLGRESDSCNDAVVKVAALAATGCSITKITAIAGSNLLRNLVFLVVIFVPYGP